MEQLMIEIQKMKQGNFNDYQNFYNLTASSIYKLILDVVKDETVATNILNETYNQIYSQISSLQNDNNFYTWAFSIATSNTFAYFRNNNMLTYIQESDVNGFNFEYITDDQENFIPENILQNAEYGRIVDSLIDKLPKEVKLMVQFFYMEGLSVTEISNRMGYPVHIVKGSLNSFRNQIKNVVESMNQSDGTRLQSMAALPLVWCAFWSLLGNTGIGMMGATMLSAVALKGTAGGAAGAMIGGTMQGGAMAGNAAMAGGATAGNAAMMQGGAMAGNAAMQGGVAMQNGMAAASAMGSSAGGAAAGMAGTAVGSSVGGTVASVAATAGMSIGAKIAITTAIIAVVGGGATFGIIQHNKQKEEDKKTEATVEVTEEALIDTEEVFFPDTEAAIIDDTEEITEEVTEEATPDWGEVVYTGKEVVLNDYNYYNVPQISVENDVTNEINTEIMELCTPYIDSSTEQYNQDNYVYSCGYITYDWYMNGNILTIMLSIYVYPDASGWVDKYPYVIDLESNTRMGKAELLNYYGLAEDEYHEMVSNSLVNHYIEGYSSLDDSVKNDFYYTQLDKTASPENAEAAVPYIGEDGELYVVGTSYSIAGGDHYPAVVKVE